MKLLIDMIRTTKLLFVLAAMLMMSCSDDDNNVGQTSQTEAQQKAEVEKSLLGLQVDLSNALMGSDDINVWNFSEDGTFELLDLSLSEAVSDGVDSLASDVYEGRWQVFVGADNPWDAASGEKVNGFTATFQSDDPDVNEEGLTMTYYLLPDVDEHGNTTMLLVNESAIDYIAMMSAEGDDVAGTRAFTNDIFAEVIKPAKEAAKEIKDFAFYIYGGHKLSSPSLDECLKFYDHANKTLATMKEACNARYTDYAEWMTQIYTQQGKNPRICDMNIPGSHDTFTSYAIAGNGWFKSYTVTQFKDIAGQWNYGVRNFDFRLANNDGKRAENGTLGLYHSLYLKITFEDALKAIFQQLSTHPGETAIACIAFDSDKNTNSFRLVYEMIEKYRAQGKIMTNPTADMTLKDCAGKLIVFQDYGLDPKGEEYAPQYHLEATLGSPYKGCGPVAMTFKHDGKRDTTICMYQNLSDGTDIKGGNDKFWKQKKEWFTNCFNDYQKERKKGKAVWCVNQVTAFANSAMFMSYSKNAGVMHPWCANFVVEHRKEYLGSVIMDFVGCNEYWDENYTCGEALPKIIVETNRFH